MSKDINELRKEIDNIDDQIAKLFKQRMISVGQVAESKKQSGKAVRDSKREDQIIDRILSQTTPDISGYVRPLYSTLFGLSRSYQNAMLNQGNELSDTIQKAAAKTSEDFPQSAVVACQGIPGAFSQIACEEVFEEPNIMYFKNFDAVFSAVEQGLCKYGILPIENSANGSVTQVYDLMKKRNFYIVRSLKLKVHHYLLTKKGTGISDIKRIYSHEQALGQCSTFLDKLENIEIIPCENTATAARMVSDSDGSDAAAIASRESAETYGLEVMFENIQNAEENYTRFICISKDMEIYEGSDKMSIMFSVPHRPGSLYEVMTRFASYDLNITKLESRPIPEKEFEFVFYFDFEGSADKEGTLETLDGIDGDLEQFKFLGNYSEI